MKTIWKFAVSGHIPTQVISLPWDYQIRKVADGFMWIEGTFGKPEEVVGSAHILDVEFKIVGTGHEVPENYEYVGTYFDPPFVWHIYKKD